MRTLRTRTFWVERGGAWRRRLRNSLQSLSVMTPKRVIMALCGAQVPLTTNLGVRSSNLFGRANYAFAIHHFFLLPPSSLVRWFANGLQILFAESSRN